MRKLIQLSILIGLLACGKEETETPSDPLAGAVPCDQVHTNRVGARCNDGTKSQATGSGACSSHGGVDYWLCK